MIPADIGARLAGLVAAAVADGELPPAASTISAAGTWRPAPPRYGGWPGTYATSLPFLLARAGGGEPVTLAGLLAERLPGAGIERAAVTGGGYLTVTVSSQELASLAPRVVAAGPACAASDALRGSTLTAPPDCDLAGAPDWPRAWLLVAGQASARLAERAGAKIKFGGERGRPAAGPAAGSRPAGKVAARESPVAAAVGWLGADAVRYELARTTASHAARTGGRLLVHPGLPEAFAMVRGAHADAAGTLRWAADLGIDRGEPDAARAGLLAEPAERNLLDSISWLPERVAGAARRRRPAELASYLERLAGCWADCQDACPALPLRGRLAPRSAAGVVARLWLAAAARTALGAGLGLLGVAAPERR